MREHCDLPLQHTRSVPARMIAPHEHMRVGSVAGGGGGTSGSVSLSWVVVVVSSFVGVGTATTAVCSAKLSSASKNPPSRSSL